MQKKTDARETALEAPSATCVNCEGSKTLDLTWQFRKDRYFSKCPQTFALCRWQWRSQPKNLEGAKKFGGANMFDFRRITLFCLEKCLSKRKMTIFSKILGGPWPLQPPWLRLWSLIFRYILKGMSDGHERRKGSGGPWPPLGFEIWYLAVNFAVEKCFSLSVGVGKMKFHHCWSPGKYHFCHPPDKSTMGPFWKKILPTPVVIGFFFRTVKWAIGKRVNRRQWLHMTDGHTATAQWRGRDAAVRDLKINRLVTDIRLHIWFCNNLSGISPWFFLTLSEIYAFNKFTLLMKCANICKFSAN